MQYIESRVTNHFIWLFDPALITSRMPVRNPNTKQYMERMGEGTARKGIHT